MSLLAFCLIQVVLGKSFLVLSQSYPQDLYIGALFTSDSTQHELAFKRGIEKANKILEENYKRKSIPYFRFHYFLMNTERFNSYAASQQACYLLEKKVIAIIGPSDFVGADQIESICSQFGIPFLDMSQHAVHYAQRRISINMYPHYSTISKCIKEYIKDLNTMDNFVILYTKSEDLIKFTDLLHDFEQRMVLKKIQFDGSEKYLMKYLQSQKYFHYIVDIPYWEFSLFMKLADYYNMTTQYYSFLFPNWDIQLLNLENLTFNTAANISTLTLFPIEEQTAVDKEMTRFQKEVYEEEKRRHKTDIYTVLTTETAIIYDSLRLIAYGFVKLASMSEIKLSTTLSCDSKTVWAPGISFLNVLKYVGVNSFTGNNEHITVDETGWRNNFQIFIRRLYNRTFFEKYGYWSNASGMKVTRPKMTHQEVNLEISKQTLRVTTIIDSPFVISLRKDANGITPKDPDAWDGFCIRLLKLIAKELGFNFTIEKVEDNMYGKEVTENGVTRWDGLVGELINRKADLAVSSLTITYDRERVIDFTTPFMNLGISIIFKRPDEKPVSLLSFLEPLSTPVWGYVIATYISVSFILFVIGRLSPYEWYNSSPCDVNPQFETNKFNILNSMWFTIGSFMQQGLDVNPRAASTRMVAVMWWFFTLIIISSYTANLAAFLTVARMKVPIENADDLSRQVKIKYGTLTGGSTFEFFKKSNYSTYQKMYTYMNNNPSLLVTSNGEGIKRVRTSKSTYAFILESTTNEFYTRRECDLVRIGGLLDSKGYGIGLPQGSRYRDIISEAILKLQKEQQIESIRTHFWRKYNVTNECDPPAPSSETSALGITEVGGVFVMLALGTFLSIFAAFFEVYYKAWKKSKVVKSSICSVARLICRQNFKKSCATDDVSQSDDQSNSSSPITFPMASVTDFGRQYPLDEDIDDNNIHKLPKNIIAPSYDFAARPTSPLYHLPPATKVQPLNFQTINHKTIFQDSHPFSNNPSSIDNVSSQVRLKKVAC